MPITALATSSSVKADHANFFYGIQEGEVEVLERTSGTDQDRAFAFLGPGDFFGDEH